MKDDEKKFFVICIRYRNKGIGSVRIREIINILYDCEFMHYKRCWYLLRKWGRLGFYNYGVTEDLGWFEMDKLPQRYSDLLQED